MTQTFFKRNEKKYILSPEDYAYMKRVVQRHMVHDEHFRSSIANIYFDTESDDLICASLESPNYKYKLRARSYGKECSDKVFFEIKSKLNGTVYKRRTVLKNSEYDTYLKTHSYPDSQVMREIDHLFDQLLLLPKIFIAYDRTSYAAADTSGLRITFDANLRSRTHDLRLTKTDECEPYFADGTCLMEIKTVGGLPTWLRHALTAHNIYPSSFSKYGKIYEKQVQKEFSYA